MKITDDSYCLATRENFEMLTLLGLDSTIDKDRIFNDRYYEKTDLFCICNNGTKFKWLSGESKSKLIEIDFVTITKYLKTLDIEFNFREFSDYDGDIKETLILF